MFSSKSSRLLEYYYKFKLKYKCLLISYKKDNRYTDEDCIITHNKFTAKSHALLELKDAYELKEYNEANVILIDEGQFFPDIETFAKNVVNKDNKILIISGLNGDYQKKPIGKILNLIPEADDIEFQKAVCHYCKTPEDAIFSLRTNSNNKNQILIGENNIYKPVCRYHFNQKHKLK